MYSEIWNTQILGYKLIREYSRTNHQKGGVANHQNDNIGYNIQPAYMLWDKPQHWTTVWADILKSETGPKKLVRYWHLQKPVYILKYHLRNPRKTQTWKSLVIFLGSINIDCLELNYEMTKLSKVRLSHNMTRLLPPTRITLTTISSIDCVCTYLNKDDIQVEIFNAGLSDHIAQPCKIDNSAPEP